MLKIVRGMIAVLVLVIVVTAIYFMIQNYKDRKLAEQQNLKLVQTATQEAQQQQNPDAKFQGEKNKVDTLVNAMKTHSNQVNTSQNKHSPF